MKRPFEPISRPGGIPGFRYENRVYRLLNLGLDVEADGVTYHLSCEFTGKGEMGDVIDRIELERDQRNATGFL